ncbi:MAG: response regulator [Acidobacteria bacterium]|nr:response regulator [Acidobacteriota bacterium]
MAEELSILVVDDEPGIRDVMEQLFVNRGYQCRTAQGGYAAMSIFQETPSQVVLSDVHMADMNGLEVTRQVLTLNPATAVVLMTGNADLEMAIQALRVGASDFLLKPFDFRTAEGSVQQAVQKKQRVHAAEHQLRRLQEHLQEVFRHSHAIAIQAIESFCETLAMRDVETYDHVRRVSHYASLLARNMGLNSYDEEQIRLGALLHDIGKVVVPDRILLKAAPLTEEEWEVMRRHVYAGYRIVSGMPGLGSAAQIVLQHHERYGGGGYPQGLRGEQICLGARIFAVADTYDAITHDRPYRKRLPDDAAREEIRRYSGIQYDPKVVQTFLQIPSEEWMRAAVSPEPLELPSGSLEPTFPATKKPGPGGTPHCLREEAEMRI